MKYDNVVTVTRGTKKNVMNKKLNISREIEFRVEGIPRLKFYYLTLSGGWLPVFKLAAKLEIALVAASLRNERPRANAVN